MKSSWAGAHRPDPASGQLCANQHCRRRAKRGSKEYRRFLDTALGSLAETAYLLMLARDLDILSLAEWEKLDSLRRRAGGLTWRLARSLEPKPG